MVSFQEIHLPTHPEFSYNFIDQHALILFRQQLPMTVIMEESVLIL